MSSTSKYPKSEAPSDIDSVESSIQDSSDVLNAEDQSSAEKSTQTSEFGASNSHSFEDGSTQRRSPGASIPIDEQNPSASGSQKLRTEADGSTETCEGSDARRVRASFDLLDVVDSLGEVWDEVPLTSPGSSSLTSPSGQEERTVISKGSLETDEFEVDDFGVLKPGSKFGQFTVVRYIGGGGMGRVYEGEDRDLERKVAIKVLPKRRAQDDGVVARFLNEAKSAARLNHENIAQVYLYGNVNGVPYIAFEYVEGVNLRDYVRDRGALELDEAVDYVLQTAAALSHAAAHGVTHRDVKPSNIIVTPKKRVKLIDMGLARLLKPKFDEDLTESGVTLGTFDYISPEQARDPRLADVRSDVYSLGCTFYYMLASAPPFPEGTMLQKLLQHQGDEAPDIREVRPSVPLEVAVVVKKMMKKNPDERYQTPDALIFDLLEIADMVGLRVNARGYSDLSSKEKSVERVGAWRLPGFFAAGLFIIFAVVYGLFPSNSDLSLPEVELQRSNETQSSGASEQTANEIRGSSGLGQGTLSSGQSEETVSDSSHGASEPLQTGVEVELGAAELNELYSRNTARYSDVFLSGSIDDGLEWRNSYLTAGFPAFESTDYAFGWRSRGVPADRESTSIDAYLETPVAIETMVCSFNVYPLLGDDTGVSSSSFTAPIVRVVDGVGKETNTFASLQAALASIVPREGQVNDETRLNVRIELKFNNALPTSSLAIDRQNVEIVAVKEYTPTLRFELPETPNGVGGESMFFLNDADVTIRGVSIDFTVPSLDAVSSEEWSVFKDVGNSTLSLSDSILTVCNMSGDVYSSPLHSNVAFFRAHAATSFGELSGDSVDAPFTVKLERVLARGEASLFISERQGSRLEVKNSGFNLAGAVMHYLGTQQSSVPRTQASSSSNEQQTNELTALNIDTPDKIAESLSPCFTLGCEQSVIVSKACLARIDAEETETLPSFRASITNSIVKLNEQALALILSPADFDASAFASQWKLDGVLALDVPFLCRRRIDRTAPYQDYHFTEDSISYELAKLSDLTSEYARLDVIAPHRFLPSNFVNYILVPTSASMTVSSEARVHAEMIKSGFFDGLVKFD